MKKLISLIFFLAATISATIVQAQPKPLDRGLMAVSLSKSGGSGNLVSWRARTSDNHNYKYKLFRGSNATAQTGKVNSGNFIMGKTNFVDSQGSSANYYRLEVYDENNRLIETEVSRKTWDDQTCLISLGDTPKDPTSAGATYTPNDASFCDMDGDGEYEIILKWSPNNEKDAASSGTTSPVFFDCVKLDGTRLWRMHSSSNQFTSAHTMQFIAWDLDGDGYGEFIYKTAPGAVDGKGKVICMSGDSPTANYKGGKGKQTSGGEYLTVFDGRTGAELQTIAYHTKYADESTSFWGDSNENRSERYLAAIAWLDGEGKNPSAIFARGYYSGAKIGAYDWDGKTLSMRWLHRAASASSGTVKYKNGTTKTLTSTVYGDGAHWISVGDCNGDGLQDIVYGSSALKHDGTTLYRGGMGHGDALHLGDFSPENPGLEVYMAHEHSPYGADLRDAKTGKILLRQTAGGDTGRGLIAHYNPEADGAYFEHSASGSIFDWKGNVVVAEMKHGGGSLQNNRIYWTGDLADEFYDKSVIETWTGGGLGRVQVNGGNYTIGSMNNGSKNNPCVMGDLLGDWREEIVLRTGDEASGYSLIINATSFPTDYLQPHLMDDFNYRAQVINQNCCYNQPPHVSYNPIERMTITRNLKAIPSNANNEAKNLGKYWDAFFTPYSVKVPEGVKVWALGNKSDVADTVKVTEFKGSVIPANCAVIYNSQTAEVKFRPTAVAATTTPSQTYLKGAYCDSLLNTTSTYAYYEFRVGDRGLGFYKAEGKVVPGMTAFARFISAATMPAHDSYVLGPNSLNPIVITDGIEEIRNEKLEMRNSDYYNLAGQRITEPRNGKHGIYIINGKKVKY